MIQDKETNLLYLADCLPKKNVVFFKEFEQLLVNNDVKYKLLPHTKDIWAVDYMPVQIDVDTFVSFIYNPNYLQTKNRLRTISDVPKILKELDIAARQSNIVLDGGNVVKGQYTVIMCDKVFSENPGYGEKALIKCLEEKLHVDKLVFIPKDKRDFTGHADGMVRFITDGTVLINKYAKEDLEFGLGVRLALHNAGLEVIELPYNPYNNSSNDDACGIYINYLEMEGLIIVPTFGIYEDSEAVKMIERLFPDKRILTIDSSEIAKEGGILNCITWNIKAPPALRL